MTAKKLLARTVLSVTALAVVTGIVALFVVTWPVGALVAGTVALIVAIVGGIDWALDNA